MTTAEDLLRQALSKLEERGQEYDKPGGQERSGPLACELLKEEFGCHAHPHDIYAVLIAVKRARQRHTPGHVDSMIDELAYRALWHEARQQWREETPVFVNDAGQSIDDLIPPTHPIICHSREPIVVRSRNAQGKEVAPTLMHRHKTHEPVACDAAKVAATATPLGTPCWCCICEGHNCYLNAMDAATVREA